MNKIFLVVVTMLMLTVSASADIGDAWDWLVEQETAGNIEQNEDLKNEINSLWDEQHYGFMFNSKFTYYRYIEDGMDNNEVLVSFGYDLNNFPFMLFDAGNFVFEEDYTFNSWIRPSTTNLPDIKDNAVSSGDVYDNDYFGLPIEIKSCFIDCDVDDNTEATRWYADKYSPEGDYWYVDINSYSGASTSWINSRFPADNRMPDTHSLLRFQKDGYSCKYDTPGTKTIKFGCVFKKNLLYRHSSPSNDDWSMNDIISEFSNTNEDPWATTVLTDTIEYDVTNKNYTSTVTETEDSDISEGEGNLNEQDTTSQRIQYENIAMIENADQINIWQNVIIEISRFVMLMFLVLLYIVSIVAIGTIMIGIFPFMFRMFNNKVEEMTKMKRFG